LGIRESIVLLIATIINHIVKENVIENFVRDILKQGNREYTIFYLTLRRGEGSVFNKHEFIIYSIYSDKRFAIRSV